MATDRIHLYPFEQLPALGLAPTPSITTYAEGAAAQHYLQYANAQRLCPEDEVVVQGLYLWTQAYLLSAPPLRMPLGPLIPPSTRPSHAELWWLTQHFEQLRTLVDKLRGAGQPERCDAHRACYDAALDALGLAAWRTTVGSPCFENPMPPHHVGMGLLHYDNVANGGGFQARVYRIARVLRLCAGLDADVMHLQATYDFPAQLSHERR